MDDTIWTHPHGRVEIQEMLGGMGLMRNAYLYHCVSCGRKVRWPTETQAHSFGEAHEEQYHTKESIQDLMRKMIEP